jgi:hypothetical protein
MYVCIFLYFSSSVVAQEISQLKEWKAIPCENIEKIAGSLLWDCSNGSRHNGFNNYLVSGNDETDSYLYEFKANKNNATLEQIKQTFNRSVTQKALYEHEKSLMYTYINQSRKFHIFLDNLIDNESIDYEDIDSLMHDGQIFMINNQLHALFYDTDGKICQLELKQHEIIVDSKTIAITKSYPLTYSPKPNTPLIVLDNTVDYFSNDGFCFFNISNEESKLIDKVEVQDETSSLVTDNQSKIWIINQTDGVIEYNFKEDTAKKIAEFPSASITKETDFAKVCFYSESYLYCITNSQVYALDLSDPENPEPEPTIPEQSGKTCGCLGLEFFGAIAGLFILRLYRK